MEDATRSNVHAVVGGAANMICTQFTQVAIRRFVDPEPDSYTEKSCSVAGFVAGNAIYYGLRSKITAATDAVIDKYEARKLAKTETQVEE